MRMKVSEKMDQIAELLDSFPDSPKAPDALLKIGYTHYELEQWDSARAALMTRGFAEMTRLAAVLGARPATLAGLSGLGDLALLLAYYGMGI